MSLRFKVGLLVVLGVICLAAADVREHLGGSFQFDLPPAAAESSMGGSQSLASGNSNDQGYPPEQGQAQPADEESNKPRPSNRDHTPTNDQSDPLDDTKDLQPDGADPNGENLEIETSTGAGIRTAVKTRPFELDFPDLAPPNKLDWDLPKWHQVRTLVWTLTALTLLLLIGLILRRMLPSTQRAQDLATAPSALDDLRTLTSGRNHDAWAHEGQFEHAIHAMLLELFQMLKPVLPLVSRPASTSREIASAYHGPAAVHVRWLVEAVELSRFAGRPIDSQTYDRALEEFRASKASLGDADA